MPKGIADLADFLDGEWIVQRHLQQAGAAGWHGRATGRASFRGDGRQLQYHECLQLDFPGFQGQGTRQYCYRLDGAARARVLFTDGRLFHHLDLRQGRWRCRHHCPPDLYCGHFRVISAERWASQWIVRGPRKNQRITTLYTRARSAAGYRIAGQA